MDTSVNESGGRGEDDAVVQPGEVIAGKYEVVEVLGSGGMGVVVAARHVELGSRVAIKFLKPELVADELSMARFMREARAAVSLSSEHVARVMDVGKLASGAPYMIMEMLRGVDLETLLEQRGPLPVEQAVHFVLQACEALAEAHALGLVHRDLKPANLFLTEAVDGSPLVKVLDFGIAKARQAGGGESAHKLTATGVALGTPTYMAPEQVRAAKDVDRRADIWGLGVVLHQLLSGEAPFDAETMPALCAKIIADPPIALESVRAEVPPAIGQAVARCLEKRADQRYLDVAALARVLAPFGGEEAPRLLERIERIAGGRTSLVPVDPGWNAVDGMAHTVASSPGLGTQAAARKLAETEHDADGSPAAVEAATGEVAPSASEPSAGGPGGSFGDTAGAWQADTGVARPGRQRRTMLLAAGLLLPLLALLWWLAPWRASAPTDTAAGTTSAELSGDPSQAGQLSSAPALTAPATSVVSPETPAPASASAQPSIQASAKPVAGRPGHHAGSSGGHGKPRPRGTSPSPSATHKPYNLLDERK